MVPNLGEMAPALAVGDALLTSYCQGPHNKEELEKAKMRLVLSRAFYLTCSQHFQ